MRTLAVRVKGWPGGEGVGSCAFNGEGEHGSDRAQEGAKRGGSDAVLYCSVLGRRVARQRERNEFVQVALKCFEAREK